MRRPQVTRVRKQRRSTPQKPAVPAATSAARTPVKTEVQDNSDTVRELERTISRLTISRQLTHEFIGNAHGVKHLVELVFAKVLETLNAEAGSLWIADKKLNKNICHLAEGPVKKRVIGLRLDPGVGIVGTVIKYQQPSIILDCKNSEHFAKSVDEKTGFVTHSMICVPLVIDGESYGAIQIVNKKHGIDSQFDEDDCELVKDLAISAALSVKNARLMEMESKVNEMQILMSIANDVVSTLDLDQVLYQVVNRSGELANMSMGAVALWDAVDKQLKLSMLSDGHIVDEEDDSQKALLSLMEQIKSLGHSSYVANREKYCAKDDNKENAWCKYMYAKDIQAIWAVPLEDDEGLLGVLWFESQEEGFANGGKADLISILASQSTVALRNASLFKSIPIGSAIGEVSAKTSQWLKSRWQKVGVITAAVAVVLTLLHVTPIFRWVSAPAIVESQLGHGVFLPINGRVKNILVRESDVVEKGDVIAELDNSSLSLQLIEAETNLAIIERRIVEARAKKDSAALSGAILERDSSRAKVQKLRSEMAQVQVTAPLAGVVLTSKTNELVGRSFSMGDELMRIADPKDLKLIAHVAEVEVLDVKPGQEVEAVLRSAPGERIHGKVTYIGRSYEIPSLALGVDAQLDTQELMTGFVAEIQLQPGSIEVRPGMTGQAVIYTPERSVVSRWFRRLRNFFSFTLGIGT